MITTLAHSSAEIAAAFRRDGFYHARGLVADRIAVLEPEFDRICGQLERSGQPINARWAGGASDAVNPGHREIQHTHNVQMYSGVWTALCLDPAFLEVAEACIGPDIVLHHTKLFRKPAEHGAAFPMHQDWSYFPTVKDSCIAAIIHVSDATDAMGCLRVHPGSHHQGRIVDSSGVAESDALQRRFPLETAVPVECRAGDVVFFHSLTVHGSRTNDSDRVRKTVLIQMYAGDDMVEPDHAGSHSDARLVLRGWQSTMNRERAR